MSKRLLIYGAIVIGLTAVGLVVSFVFLGEDPPAAPPRLPVEPVQPVEQSTEVAQPAMDTSVDSDSAAAETVEVVEVKGSATRLADEGEWVQLEPGQMLAVDEAIKTEPESQVTLKIGEQSTVELAENAEVRVREVSDSVQRLGLVKGRISADYQEDGSRVLRIENEDGSAVAEVRKGAFSIANTGATVAVATETGSVDLSAGGEKVIVAAGEQSVVAKGDTPTRPMAIPVDVLLKVVDPGCRVQRERTIVINGRTSPGSSVRINDVNAKVGVDGSFRARVPLIIGKNRIVVVTEDVLGRNKRRLFPCVTVDPGAPIKTIDIKWGTSKKGKGA
ncbi:MAG: FecR domain-containing protein [Deltaproteobacteria bacterium]|nr:FecR domain-containing protein [Deltaproteobacteria bacterium]